MAEPVLALRTHKGTPEKLWEKAAEMIQLGLANPGFFNDDIAIPIVLSKGAAIEDALDWVIVGCTQPSPGGGSEGTPDAGYVSAAKALELALNNGVDPVTGKLSGIETGDARGFTKREELTSACITQMLHQYEMIRDGFKITQSHHMTRLPVMLASMTTGGCIESGKSLQDGGSTYKSAGLFITGPANLVDSIVAVDRVVFRDKIVTMDELLAALAKNFEGEERLRQLLLSQPKFGNDDPEVNELASSIMKRVAGTVQTWRDARGGRFDFTMMSQSVNVPQGKAVGATPDGRRAGEPVSDNSSPMMGRDIVGPTATVRSVASWNQLNFHDGALFNLRFDPRSVQGDKGRDIITGVIKTYFAEGGQHIQINVVDNTTLRAAQEKPENYRSLVVRVAGYMAYFTELDRDVQESIIARTAHSA
jgi:formate C-acetyltransferase